VSAKEYMKYAVEGWSSSRSQHSFSCSC